MRGDDDAGTIYPNSPYARDGGLLSYGGVYGVDNWRRVATYVDRILRGAKPAELPRPDRPRELGLPGEKARCGEDNPDEPIKA